MKYVRGFLMAWGNFSAIPCPYRKWHDDDRRAMLCMLPLVGLVLGALAMCAWFILEYIGTPPVLTGILVTAAYFLMTGFIHLDGFMDCSDAILSRRPELAERQRILKDSTVGAFAVICVVLMFLVFAVSIMAIAQEEMKWKGVFLLGVMTMSRCLAADAVLWKPAMRMSQYASLDRRREDKSLKEITVLWFAALLPLLALCASMVLLGFLQSYEAFKSMVSFVGAVVVTACAAHITGFRDRRDLGGMNGDIAGHMVTMSETIGVLAAALLAAWY